MSYFITCIDKPNSLAKLLSIRENHISYLTKFKSKLVTAGPLIGEDGNPYGSLLILDFKVRSELEDFLKNYKLGNLLGFEGIQAGIENTNYFIYMSSGKYVLTIFEKLSLNEAQFYLEFMLFLSSRKTLCPMPIVSTSDQLIRILKGYVILISKFYYLIKCRN